MELWWVCKMCRKIAWSCAHASDLGIWPCAVLPPFYIVHFTHFQSCMLRSQPNIALIKNGLNYMNYQCKILGFYIWSFLAVIVQDSLAFILHSFCSILRTIGVNLDVFMKNKDIIERPEKRWGMKRSWPEKKLLS